MKNKLILTSLWLSFSLISACTGQGQNTTSPSSGGGKPSSEFLINGDPHKIAYATQSVKSRNSYDSNIIAKILEDNAMRYNYTMPGWPDFKSFEGREVFTNSKEGGNYYGVNKLEIEDKKYSPGQVVQAIVKKWESLGVELGFVESNPDSNSNNVNDQNLYNAIKNEEFSKKLILMGDNTSGTNDKDGKVIADQPWSKLVNVATFEFSEIISAYNTGYQTQSHFGLRIKEKDGKLVKEKLDVGYIVASIKKDDRITNIKNVRKANAFRQGVVDAVKEQNTGEAKFVEKEEVSDDEDAKKLFWGSGDIKRFSDLVRSNKKYLNQDHSIFYLAGASGRENSLAADSLILSGTTNINGHKMVIERSFDGKGVFEGLGKNEKGTNLRAGSANNFHVRGRIRMNGRFYSDKHELDYGWEEAKNSMKGLVVEAVIESLYGSNQDINYFGKHTKFGNLASIDPTTLKGGRSALTGQKINKKYAKEIKLTLLKKSIDEKSFEDNFLGSGY